MKKVKILISMLLLLSFSQTIVAQVDMLTEGLQSCLNEDEFVYINQLFNELETYSFEILNIERNNYEELTNAFCQINQPGTFIISEKSELSKLIKKGINSGFWIFDKYEPNNRYIIDGDTIEIIPPGQSEYIPPPSESMEQAYIDSESKYISCSRDYTFHVAMRVFYQNYESHKVMASMVKLCSMVEFFSEENYDLASIKHYILIHCICQRIIHENDYYRYFEK